MHHKCKTKIICTKVYVCAHVCEWIHLCCCVAVSVFQSRYIAPVCMARVDVWVREKQNHKTVSVGGAYHQAYDRISRVCILARFSSFIYLLYIVVGATPPLFIYRVCIFSCFSGFIFFSFFFVVFFSSIFDRTFNIYCRCTCIVASVCFVLLLLLLFLFSFVSGYKIEIDGIVVRIFFSLVLNNIVNYWIGWFDRIENNWNETEDIDIVHTRHWTSVIISSLVWNLNQ